MKGEPRRLDVRDTGPDDESLAPVVRHLQEGGLVACPTDTVYGFGCALEPGGLASLRGLKRREEAKPFLVLVADAAGAAGLVWNDDARELARAFWPGALTLVLADPGATFPDGVRGPAGGVAVRVPAHPLARGLAARLQGGLTSTSANPPGGVSARDGEGALAAALALGADEHLWVLDAGTLPASPPSTIVDCTGAAPVVLREGAIPLARLRCALPGIDGR